MSYIYEILKNSNNFTLQASATVIPYWYLADIDRGIVKDKFIVGWIFCKHIIIDFIKFSWVIFVKAVSFSENSLKKKTLLLKIIVQYINLNYCNL